MFRRSPFGKICPLSYHFTLNLLQMGSRGSRGAEGEINCSSYFSEIVSVSPKIGREEATD
ncbi:hypothetical protein Glo7428_1660 [Gloeocapsa sp. PCC 7428]|nr:hypothetical protein Glo7428_1660 [Gloeocapsa sp. PCC 7428]